MHYINPSAINNFLYCEAQFYLIYGLGYMPVKTRSLVAGLNKHREMEKAVPPLSIPFPEALEKAFSGEIGPVRAREVWVESKRWLIRGRIDEVQVERGLVRLVEDKLAGQSGRLQLFAYALAFKDQFGDYPLELILRNDRGESKFAFGTEEEREVKSVLERMISILEGRKRPRKTENGNKCRVCGVRYACF